MASAIAVPMPGVLFRLSQGRMECNGGCSPQLYFLNFGGTLHSSIAEWVSSGSCVLKST